MQLKKVAQWRFGHDLEASRTLGAINQPGSMMAVVDLYKLWKKLPVIKKIISLITGNIMIDNATVDSTAESVFIDTIFGNLNNYGPQLMSTMAWHNSREWKLSELTEGDLGKIEGLRSLVILNQKRHAKVTSDYLELNVFHRHPQMTVLLHAIVVKTPVITVRYGLEMHPDFAFNAIREAGHAQSDDLIAYLYEVLIIQQRLISTFHDLMVTMSEILKKDDSAVLSMAEADAMRHANFIITDLKATIEKVMVILALTFGETKLDGKKDHKAKVSALNQLIPEKTKAYFYGDFIFEHMSPQAMERLNNLRTGAVHKKGVSDLQPHKYVGKAFTDLPIFKMFDTLLKQHADNTVFFICALAILTDRLSFMKPHGYAMDEIPVWLPELKPDDDVAKPGTDGNAPTENNTGDV